MSDAEKYERGLRAKALLKRIEDDARREQEEDMDEYHAEPPAHKEPQIVRTGRGYIWR